MKEVTIKVPDGKRAEWQEVNGVQTLVLVDEKPQNVMERVKTFEDACKELGDEHPFVETYKNLLSVATREEFMKDGWGADFVAYAKLRIIVAALNEGWEPKFTVGEYRWFPWYWLKTKAEMETLNKEEKRRAVLRSGVNASASSGLVYARANYASTSSNTYYGVRLAFKSEELADYAGVQFREIYADFCFRSE